MVSYEPSRVIRVIPEILSALPLTLWILVVTVLLGSLLGFLLAYAQISREASFSKIAIRDYSVESFDG